MSTRRDDEFTDYIAGRLWSLRRIAYLLCQDWQRADDLVQAAITRLYVHWGRARAVEHIDAYARTILVREFLSERRSGWARRVSLHAELPDQAGLVGCSPGTIKSQTAKALESLRKALGPSGVQPGSARRPGHMEVERHG